MIIRNYACDRFAGIKNTNISFNDGLNVIVGNNEAGKSTVVEGIFSVLFKSAKLDNRAKDDKDFLARFMPVPRGDSIDGELTVNCPEGDFKLKREWGISPSSKLVTPDSGILKDEDSIQRTLADILLFGEGTYSNIIFSRQQFIKEAIERITGDSGTTREVGALLRKAVMELDGVSLEDLGQQIDSALDKLLKRWDLARNYPEGNRGINSPYLNGLGEIISAYYKKETIKRDMETAEAAENQFEKICAEMKETEKAAELTQAKIASMEKIADDMNARDIIEPKLDRITSDLALLARINNEWPVNIAKLEMLTKELEKQKKRSQAIEKEKELIQKSEEKKALTAKIEKIDALRQKMEELKKNIDGIQPVTSEDIDEMEKNSSGMIEAQVAMKAGTMYATVNKAEAGIGLFITKDLDEPVKMFAGKSYHADGFIKLAIDDKVEVEIKSGGADFSQLRAKYAAFKEKLDSQLASLHVECIAAAKLQFETLAAFKREVAACREKIDETLAGETYETISEKIQSFGDLSQVRPLAAIEAEVREVISSITDVTAEIRTLEATTKQWRDEYTDTEGLLDRMLELKAEQNAQQQKLDTLAPLPEEYASTSEFKNELTALKANHERLNRERLSQKDVYYEAERNLPESSYEEFASELVEAESRFDAMIQKARKMLAIKEAFDTTRASMDTTSFDKVIESFSKNMTALTNGIYGVCDIDDDFALQIKKDAQTVLPIDLLSAGTYDSVALALRLAILENILTGIKGFLVLDDCLVDLDPNRKAKAAELIKSFSKNHQVIFTTCSPDTAKLLGGNTIQM